MEENKIMIIGYGVIGKIHYKVLKSLNQNIVSIVDTNPDKLKDLDEDLKGIDLRSELINKKPNIILVSSNTSEHINNLKNLKEIYHQIGEKLPSVFIEKPLMDNRFEELKEFYKNLNGFKFSTAYLIRYSPNINKAIEFLKKQNPEKIKVGIVWKKERGNARPSAGIHIDETTHAVDIVLSYILPRINREPDKIVLEKIDTVYSDEQINKEEQEKLYEGRLPEPSAEVNYKFSIPNKNILVLGYSSFLSGPIERRITFYIPDFTVELIFDKEQKDMIIIKNKEGKPIVNESYDLTKPENNRIRNEWIDFLNYHRTGNQGILPTVKDSLFDVFISESLVLKVIKPTVIFDNKRVGFFKVGKVLRALFSKRNK